MGSVRSKIHGRGDAVHLSRRVKATRLPEEAATTVHRVKVSPYGAKPPLWRRLEIPSFMPDGGPAQVGARGCRGKQQARSVIEIWSVPDGA